MYINHMDGLSPTLRSSATQEVGNDNSSCIAHDLGGRAAGVHLY